jgi:DNA-binding phage protein
MKAFMEGRGFKLLSFEDYEIEEFRKDPEMAAIRLKSELEEYLETGDPFYLIKHIEMVLKAYGRQYFIERTGLVDKTIDDLLEARIVPTFAIVARFIGALGYSLKLKLDVAGDMDSAQCM